MSIEFEIKRRRRAVRSSTKPRIAELGQADGTLYCPDGSRLWARWIGRRGANGNATQGQPFPVWAGSSNYLPEAGRQVYIGMRYGKLTILDAVPEDLVKAGVDLRGLNPNDPYRAFLYTINLVPLRSDPLANEGEDTLKVNLNQLLYLDAYGDYNLFNGTDENTHIDHAVAKAGLATDEHRFAIVALRTLENDWQTVASTPKDNNTPLDLADLQECKDQLDPETLDSRVYRIAFDMDTLIANPVTDWDLRQWLNMPPRLGNPNPVTKNERVREGQQVIYHDFLEVTGWLEVLGEVIVIDDVEAESGGGSGGMTSFDVTADGNTETVTDGAAVEFVDSPDIEWGLSGLMLMAALSATPTIASFVNAGHNHQNAAGGGSLDAAALGSGTLNNARVNWAAPGDIGTTTPAKGWFSELKVKFGSFFALLAGTLTANRTYTLPDYDATLATLAGTETLANKTLTTPTIASFANAQHNHTNAAGGGQLTDAALSAPVGIAKGGTGQTSQTPAFDALAPTTTKGDLIVHNGSHNIRVARGADGSGLISDPDAASGISWSTRPLLMQMRLGIGTSIAAGAVRGTGSTSITLAPYAGDMISLWDDATGFWRDYNGAPNGVGDVSFNLAPSQNGTRTNGSAVITGLTDTSVLMPGMNAVGAGIPGSTTILTIDSSTQVTLTANASSSGTASIAFAVPAGKMFDVFAYQSGGDVKLQLVFWTNDTTRATAINQTTARTIIKNGVPTHRYLGTAYTQSAGAINEWRSSTSNRLMHLWSLYHRIPIMLQLREPTDSWAYTSTTIRQARADATNQFDVISGLDEASAIHVNLVAAANQAGASVGVGVDSTTTFDSANIGRHMIVNGLITTHYAGYVPLGRHIYSWNERGIASNSFFGDAGTSPVTLQTGMVGLMEG